MLTWFWNWLFEREGENGLVSSKELRLILNNRKKEAKSKEAILQEEWEKKNLEGIKKLSDALMSAAVAGESRFIIKWSENSEFDSRLISLLIRSNYKIDRYQECFIVSF